MLNSLNVKALTTIFTSFPQVKLVYFFGSKAQGKGGPLSDFDFAVFLDEKDVQKRFKVRLDLLDRVSRQLQTDKIDLVVLNDLKGLEFKYSVIKDGKLIYKKEPYEVLVEPRILNEYFDFMDGLRRYGLTKNI